MKFKCPKCKKVIVVNIGALIGSVSTEKKADAVRENGKAGGYWKQKRNLPKP